MKDSPEYLDTVFQIRSTVRLVLLVAFSDGRLDSQELDEAIRTFSALAGEYFGEHDPEIFVDQVERIADELPDEIYGMDGEQIFELAMETAKEIDDPSSQEVALIAALRVAYGDEELDSVETRCITALANEWGISLKSLAAT